MSVISIDSLLSSDFNLSEDDPYDKIVRLEEEVSELSLSNEDLHAQVITLQARLHLSVNVEDSEIQTPEDMERSVYYKALVSSADRPGALAVELERSLLTMSPGKVKRLIMSMTTQMGSMERHAAERDTYVRFLEKSLNDAHDDIIESRAKAVLFNEESTQYEVELDRAHEEIRLLKQLMASDDSDKAARTEIHSMSTCKCDERSDVISEDEESPYEQRGCQYFSIDGGVFDRVNSEQGMMFDEDEFMSCITEWDGSILIEDSLEILIPPMHVEVSVTHVTKSLPKVDEIQQVSDVTTVTTPLVPVASLKQSTIAVIPPTPLVPVVTRLSSPKEERKARIRAERLQRQSVAIRSVLAYHARRS